MTPLRIALLAVVAVVIGVPLIGWGMGDPPSTFPAPAGAELQASKDRIAAGGPEVQKGKEEFAEHGCGACHALAATGDDGKLGPRMDAQARDDVEEITENILEPEEGGPPGYELNLMPQDYGKRIGVEDVGAIAAFIKAASGDQSGGGPPGGGPPPGGGSPPDDDDD